jgi:hypothetical protein
MAVHVLAGDHIVSSDTIPSLKQHLPHLGNGVSRHAYDLGNGQVLKVGNADGWAGGNATEVAAWEALKDSDVGHLLAPIVAHDSEDFGWLIMLKMDGTIHDLFREDDWVGEAWYAWGCEMKDDLDRAGINDMHDGNIGYVITDHDAQIVKFYAIDYAMSRGCHASYSASTPRRYDACCDSAMLKASDCATLEGCRAEICDAPRCWQNAVQDLGTLRELRQRHHWEPTYLGDHVWTEERAHVCAQHAPIDRNFADMMREHDGGQIGMFGPWFARQF